MSDTPDIDALLQSTPSNAVAGQLVAWADLTRNQIARGDMMLGILTFDEVAKIPVAYQTAAQHGEPSAWVTLAWWHAYPDFGEPDLKSAEYAIAAAIDANVENAKLELAKIRWFFKRDSATESETQQAYQFVSEVVASDPDDADAIYILALLTTHGFGVAASPESGFELQERSADLGNADAMFEIYAHHANGLGVPVDEELAFNACQRAANAGHSRAMYNLGAFNATGRGTPKNMPEAVKWYERAADAGNPSAMAGLAVIYATGDGVEMDHEYAQEMFDQADYCGLDVSHLREQVGL
ncbi:tetratricopeptide repeat protein [Stieleria varia]|uniref:Localization factor PodJL n=1 Tax=Stieleria varia TaxID=2528005 RepID=A0A5C5ZMY0_9BACT|nr:tetratricopeptide repeat protein [Stieleria varia]TWT87803.1 Localization factor PodJL [Stieleria varia]